MAAAQPPRKRKRDEEPSERTLVRQVRQVLKLHAVEEAQKVRDAERSLRGPRQQRESDAAQLLKDTEVLSLSWAASGDMLAYAMKSGEFRISALGEDERASYVNVSKKEEGYIRSLAFTHCPTTVIYGASEKRRKINFAETFDVLREQSVRKYQASEGVPVSHVALSPTHDYFLMCQGDGSVHMFDLRTPNKVSTLCGAGAKTCVEGNVACWRPDGKQLAATMAQSPDGPVTPDDVFLFDIRKLQAEKSDRGIHYEHFASQNTNMDGVDGVRSMEYSPCQRHITVKRNDGQLVAFPLDMPVHARRGARHLKQYTLVSEDTDTLPVGNNATYSPFGAIATGNEDGTITAWESPIDNPRGLLSPYALHHLDKSTPSPKHVAPVGPLAWNPRYNMLASACHVVFLWTD